MESSWKSGLSIAEGGSPSRLGELSLWRTPITAFTSLWQAKRSRAISLSWFRVMLLSLGIGLALASALGALQWSTQRSEVRLATRAAAHMVDERLDQIQEESIGLKADLASVGESRRCESGLSQLLLRASLRSEVVQRWIVQHDLEGWQCGPEGLDPRPSRLAQSRLRLGHKPSVFELQRNELGELVLVHAASAEGLRLLAQLDRRALLLPSDGRWSRTAALGLRFSMPLPAEQGRVHTLWDSNQAGAPDDSPATLWVHSSPVMHHGGIQHAGYEQFEVQAHVDPARWQAASWTQVLLVIALTGLLTALTVMFTWGRAMRRARLTRKLEAALKKRQFEPWVQPIVDLNTGLVVGMEVLMRWRHPHRGIVAPGEFIALAEKTGLIGRMSMQTMTKAAMQLAPIFRARPDLYLSVNVTPWQLRQAGIAASLRDVFNDDTITPSQVVLEVTERDIVDASARSTLFDLRAQGWRLAIDDFGTGHSSLAVLESLPVDRLKIDRAFVSSIGEQTASRPVLDAVIDMARSLGIALIAEGIETSAQWDYLRAQGVGSAQGYMIAKPMPVDQFNGWLAERGEIDRHVLAAETPDTTPSSTMSTSMTGTLSLPGGPPTEAHGLSTSHGNWHAEVSSLWERMIRERGVELRDRMHALRVYRNCFIARDAVDWLVQDQNISRKEAVRIGRHWVARGWVRHVLDEHDFSDAVLFFTPCSHTRVKADDIPTLMSLLQSAKTNDRAGPFPASDVVRGLLIHRRCTSGRNLVNWVMNLHPVTRAQATQWARVWMQQGRIRHVYDDREFVDGPELYRLT